jgi:hypothetical protein
MSDKDQPIDIQVTPREFSYIVAALFYMRNRLIDYHHAALQEGKVHYALIEHKRVLEVEAIERKFYELSQKLKEKDTNDN